MLLLFSVVRSLYLLLPLPLVRFLALVVLRPRPLFFVELFCEDAGEEVVVFVGWCGGSGVDFVGIWIIWGVVFLGPTLDLWKEARACCWVRRMSFADVRCVHCPAQININLCWVFPEVCLPHRRWGRRILRDFCVREYFFAHFVD